MRRSIGRSWRIPNDQYNVLLNNTPFLLQSASPFSTSGRGRGGGFSPDPSKFGFTRDNDEPERESSEQTPVGFGHGRGRPSGQVPPPSFGSFVRQPQTGFGRGRGGGEPPAGDRPPVNSQFRQPNFMPKKDGGGDFGSPQMNPQSRQPNFIPKDGGDHFGSSPKNTQSRQPVFTPEKDGGDFDSPRESVPKLNPNPALLNGANLHSSVVSGLSGTGRGKPMKQPDPASQVKEENRHLRVRSPAGDQSPAQPKPTADASPAQPQLSREEAIKKAMGILARGDDNQSVDAGAVSGRGGGGRGRGRGMGRGGRGRGGQFAVGRGNVNRSGDEEDPYGGTEEDEQKFLEMIGLENASKFLDEFEEACNKVAPPPLHEAYVDAYHTNCMLECEPEYLMGDLCTNPDVDEKPIIPLRDALEKMKPFLVAYSGIQNQEEWEEAVKQTMEQQVPLWENIIDQYCGPDRITAKKQQEELENVAKTVPNSAPASVKHFTNRALLSIQNNPSWGFNKKYQLMDKLVREVSQ